MNYFCLKEGPRHTSTRLYPAPESSDSKIGHLCPEPLLQSEAKGEAIDMKMSFNYDANKTHFQNKGFALGHVLKVRVFGIQRWLILLFLLLPSLQQT